MNYLLDRLYANMNNGAIEQEVFGDDTWWINRWEMIKKSIAYSRTILSMVGKTTNPYVWLAFKNWAELLAWFYGCILSWRIPVFLDHENFADLWNYSLVLSDFISTWGSNIYNSTKGLANENATINVVSNQKQSTEAMVILTSWTTTWKSKKVVLSDGNVEEVVDRYSEIYWLNKWKVIASTLPNYYSFSIIAWMVTSMANWGKFVWLDDVTNSVRTAYYINNHKVNIILWNPNSLLRLALDANFEIPTVELCDSWWIPLSRKTRKIFKERLWITLSEGYWLTETSTLTHFRKNTDSYSFPWFVWRKIKGVDTIVKPLFPWFSKKVGILLVSGKVVTPWYLWGNHNLERKFNASTRKVDEYYNTEDVVYEDSYGNLYVLWRYSDLMWIWYTDLLKLAHLRESAYEIEWVNEITIHRWNDSWYFIFVWIWKSDLDEISVKINKLIRVSNISRNINLVILDRIPKNINWKPLLSSILSKY